jgi:hypothetical protein
MSITFDGPNKIISYDDSGASVEIDAKDLYSRWKDWVALGNAQYPAAFRTIGGDPLGGSVRAGDYYFLNNADGWRLRPKEADHELVIVGNLYGENPALPVFAATIGSYNVLVQRSLSSLTQTVAVGSGLSTEEQTKLDEVHQRLGLTAGKPLTQTATQIATDDFTLAVAEPAAGTVTVTRQ